MQYDNVNAAWQAWHTTVCPQQIVSAQVFTQWLASVQPNRQVVNKCNTADGQYWLGSIATSIAVTQDICISQGQQFPVEQFAAHYSVTVATVKYMLAVINGACFQ